MTRKDFQLIAATIKDMPTFAPSLRTAQASAARAFADTLASTNAHFDRARFLSACGVQA